MWSIFINTKLDLVALRGTSKSKNWVKRRRNVPHLAINNPFGQERIVTGSSNWSKPWIANQIFELIPPNKSGQPWIPLFLIPQRRPSPISTFKHFPFYNGQIPTVAVKYTTSYTYHLHEISLQEYQLRSQQSKNT